MGVQRIRSIKPEFFVHERLAEVSFGARLLFIGLWTIADREGRLEDRPRRLKAQVFPYDAVDIDALLEELVRHNFVRRYKANSRSCLDIPTFLKHQRPNVREPASELPECMHVHARARTCVHEPPARAQGTGTGTGIGTGKEQEGSLSLRSRDLGFESFWLAYPKKRHKPAAQKAWTQLGEHPDVEGIVAGVSRWQASEAWRRGFMEDPATFLRQRQWEDVPTTTARDDSTAAVAARARALVEGH